MKKITRLTPSLLKRIIAEEKRKLSRKKSKKSTIQEQISSIAKLRRMQRKKAREIKAINELKRRIKKSLIKRL